MKSICPSEFDNPSTATGAVEKLAVEIEKYSLPTGNVEYPIDTSELKALYAPELHTDTLVGTDMMYNYTTGQYDAMPVRWFESGMDLVDYVPAQGRAVYAELIANGDPPIRAMQAALTLVIEAMEGGNASQA